ncbi:MAG: HEAT repeat domain-containing protein [Planctomycetes bacterium]|nr:HEAT repeat domain-containing protein [Planctomycetota bacterium]
MRNAIIGWSVLGALLGSGTVRAQHEEALAKAYQLEEVEGRVAEALAGYESVAAATKLPERPCFDALLGKARCLRRLARFDEAAAVVAELEAAKFPWAIGNTVKLERERLERARGEQDEERKKLREEISTLLLRNDEAGVLSLGARAIPTLVELARVGSKEQMQPIHLQALVMLFRQSDPAAIAAVLELLRVQQLPIAEKYGIPSLPRGNQLALDWDAVIRAFAESPDADVRLCAAQSLASVRSPAPELVRRVLGDPDPRVRRALLSWLTEAPPWVSTELWAEVVRTLASDSQIVIRRTVVGSLSQYAQRSLGVAREVAELLTRDELVDIRESSFRALYQQLGVRRQRELLERGLADAVPEMRVLSAELDRRVLVPGDRVVLLPLLKHPDKGLRKRVAALLMDFSPEVLAAEPEHVELLWSALDDGDAKVRFLAIRSLGLVLSRQELSRILPLLQDGSPNVRGAVLESVIRNDAHEAVPALVAVLPQLDGVPHPRNEKAKISHVDLLRWLIEKNHRQELDQVLGHISELTLSEQVIGLLDAALDAEQKSALLRTVSSGERAANALHALRRFGRGNPDFLRICLELRSGTVDPEPRARLTSILCEEGGLEFYDAILEELSNPTFRNSLGGERTIEMYFARWTDETRRPRLEEALRGALNVWGAFAYGKQLEEASFAYLQAVANSAPSESGGTYAYLAALAKHTDPNGPAAVLAALRGTRFSASTTKSGWLARGTSLGEDSKAHLSVHVLALYLGRPAQFASYAREILGDEIYEDSALPSAVLLCALLPDGSGDAVILESLGHANGTVRAAAARAAAHLLLAGAIPRLKELLRDHEASFEANQALLRFAAFGYPIR